MIDTFRDQWLHAFYVDGEKHRAIPPGIEAALTRKLDIIDTADTEVSDDNYGGRSTTTILAG